MFLIDWFVERRAARARQRSRVINCQMKELSVPDMVLACTCGWHPDRM